MTAWNPDLYLQFGDERTRPSFDLVARVAVAEPRRVVDLGCGPGNSTAVLKRRWPAAEVVGLDNSPEMIAAATKADPNGKWVLGDAATWTATEPADVVFSNATLHWIPDHATAIPHLYRQVAPGGALAVQMPAHFDSPIHRLIATVADRPGWKGTPATGKNAFTVHRPEAYYDILAPLATSVDVWVTEYQHIMPDATAVLNWIRGTGLRPTLAALADAERAEFERQLLAEIERAFPKRPDGKVLFPFRRLFVVARRNPDTGGTSYSRP
ncbi:MAG TPA: trans-aconitate 2-methyltransferase [Fimbriiglobus sp.]|jgi:trans-aconitate 2-methyltransferase